MTNTGTPPKGKGGKFGFLKDKKVQIGLAAAGGVGLIVLLKKGSGDQSASDPNQNGQSSYSPSTYDSSSYDAYAQLSSGLGDAISQFGDQLTDIQTQLGKINGPSAGGTTGGGTTGGTTNPGGVSTQKPNPAKKPKPPPKPKASYVYTTKFTSASAARGSNWESTLSTIASHYHTSVSNLLKLNPSIHNANKIGVHQKIRVK